MKTAKVVYMVHRDPEFKEAFMAAAPPYVKVVVLEPGSPDDLIVEAVRDADFLVCTRASHTKGRFPDGIVQGSRLKLIQTIGQGTDHIPVRLALDRGIPVANSGGGNAVAVAEHTVLLMLAVLRRLLRSVETVRAGKWRTGLDRQGFHQLSEKTVGIVGFGSIGQHVARLVRGFGAEVLFVKESGVEPPAAAELSARRVELRELLRRADVVTLHVPLRENTWRMIGAPELAMMKRSAILVNTSRGAVVDERALIQAVGAGTIAGAGIDVFEEEPVSRDNPLLAMDKVVATPHIAGLAIENWGPRLKSVWDNIIRVWEGKPAENAVTTY